MLAELLPLSHEMQFGEARLCLRYDMDALLRLEREGLTYEDIFAEKTSGEVLLKFLRAGLEEDIGVQREIGLLETLGAAGLWAHLRAAVTLALPEYDPLIIPDTTPPKGDGKPDYARLRTLVCDVMKKPEEFFWKSTLRELLARWQSYAVAKGYAKEPERVQIFDTEGMTN